MLHYSDIHLEDLSNLSVKSFTQLLINDFYPLIFCELNKLEDDIQILKSDYDTEILFSTHKRIYNEFDELYRKEKLVLFPYIVKLEEENMLAESCTPFKNIKMHYASMMHHIECASDLIANFFINEMNNNVIDDMEVSLEHMKQAMIKVQEIKEKNFYKRLKSCKGCGNITP